MTLSTCLLEATRWTFGQSSDGHVNDQINSAVYRDQMYMSLKLLIPQTTSAVTVNWTMLQKNKSLNIHVINNIITKIALFVISSGKRHQFCGSI